MKFFVLILLSLNLHAQEFPTEWWQEVDRTTAASWEILPQDAKEGEVILSKRTELGIFSNFAATPILLEGKKFASIEGLWQSLKYPDPNISTDSRHKITEWKWSRSEVEMMTAFEAKKAGDEANILYKKYQLTDVSWGDYFFNPKDYQLGSEFHYQLIFKASLQKLNQNEGLWNLLLKTKCLKLKADHHQGTPQPPAYDYPAIYMKLRDQALNQNCLNN